MKDRPVPTTEIVLNGVGASPGIAVGKAFHFAQIDLKTLEENRLPIEDVDREIERFTDAVKKSIEQLSGLKESGKNEDLADIMAIFQVHIQLLTDADFLTSIPALISRSRSNAEYVLANQIRDLEKRFLSIDNEITRARLLDVQDVYFRLLRNVLDIEHVRATPLRRMPSSVILVAERLLPSDIALLDLKKIIGIAIENGSTVSHVSIIAKTLCIPVLINVHGISALSRNASLLILDANEGKAVLRPSPDTVARYEKKAKQENHPHSRSRQPVMKCFTKDGIKIRLEANAGSAPEVREAIESGAEGIGLLRSELYYLSRDSLPTIDEETAFYESVQVVCGAKPLTVRLLDIGADKTVPYLRCITQEENPHFGVRGIRLLLRNPELLHNHLVSILRACRKRHVKILLPFVSIPHEVDEVRSIISDISKKEGVHHSAWTLGMMLEVPSTVLMLGEYMDKIDFLSIGTNDLIQYLFATGRENSGLEKYRAAAFPLLLRLIKSVVDTAASAKKELSVCGEIAADPAYTTHLIGAGVRVLSMQSCALHSVCTALSNKTMSDCVKMAKAVLKEQA
jgi:phosphotransferase system enzyme I (PtsI)